MAGKKEKEPEVAVELTVQMGEPEGNTAPSGASPPFSGEVPSSPPEAPPRRTKAAIVGFADSWPMAPYHHPEWEIWCLNQFYDLIGAGPNLQGGHINLAAIAAEGRLRWFDQHDRHDLECDPNVIKRHPHHVQRLKEIGALGVPVIMQQVWPDIPNSREYPLKRLSERFDEYWTNSVSYMIAMAIDEGYTEIGLYGVNMAQDTEYGQQRPSCEYIVGFARGLGVKVRIPPQSDLLKAPYIYGYEDDKTDAMVAKLDEMAKSHQAQMIDWARKRDEAEAYYQQFNGAFQATQATKRYWTIGK